MAVSLTPQNKQTLKRLLKSGRWNNESEIVRYGLHLVDQETQQQDKQSEPGEVKKILAEMMGKKHGRRQS